MSERTIKVNKATLIEKIKENRENHQKEFKEAVKAYKEESLKQLEKNMKRISKKGNTSDLAVKTDLIVPVDETEKYDKLITQFEWELEDQINISQREFNEYVHDDTNWARSAKFANTSYLK